MRHEEYNTTMQYACLLLEYTLGQSICSSTSESELKRCINGHIHLSCANYGVPKNDITKGKYMTLCKNL